MNDFVKKANEESEYSLDRLRELDKCRKDPIYFASKYVKIQHPLRGAIQFTPYEYQVRAIRAFQAHTWSIFKCGRQMGKTTIIAIYLLWFACFHSDKYVLVASKKNADALDIMTRIKFAYEELPNWLKPGCSLYNRQSVEFDNKSTIVSATTTEDTGRGRSVALLMLDELAFVRGKIQQAMWTSLAPTLSTGGSCIISSTPNGDSELFAQLWRQAKSGKVSDEGLAFHPVEVRWDEHPDRDEKYKQMMIDKLGDENVWLQEYECEFISSDPLLIQSRVLQGLTERKPLFEDKGFKFWKELHWSKTYVVSVDVAEGVKQDFSTIEVFDLDGLEQVAEYRSNKVKEDALYSGIKWILEKLLSTVNPENKRRPTVYWSFENNSAGAAIGALYENDDKFPVDAELISETKANFRYGFRTTGKSKPLAARHLKTMLERTVKTLKVHSSTLIFELKNYIATGASYEARDGCTDDLVSALLIFVRVIKQLSTFEPQMFDLLYKTEETFHDDDEDPLETIVPLPVIMPH